MSRKSREEVRLVWPGKEASPSESSPTGPSLRFRPAELYHGAAAEPVNPTDAPGRLYVGDNRDVLTSLQTELAGHVDFTYIDPPFCTGNQYQLKTVISDHETRQELHHAAAYSDRWEGGIEEYLSWLYPRIRLMYELLAPTGSFVIHLDWRAACHVRLLLDEVFGPQQLVNEIVWYKGFRGTRAQRVFQHAHDILWWYVKGEKYFWEQDFEPYKDREMRRYNKVDEHGRRYARIKRRRGDGSIYYGKTYPGTRGKWRNDVIADVPTMAATSAERTGFATQKPVRLLEILISSLCPPGGLVADFFCGTGTTLRAAARLGCRFVGVDQGSTAIHFTRRGLLAEQRCPPFTVFRPPEEIPPAPNRKPSWLQRDRAGVLRLGRRGGDDQLLEFWAVGPGLGESVFSPTWFTCGNGPQGLPTASPPFDPSQDVTVFLSGRDGRELWFQVERP